MTGRLVVLASGTGTNLGAIIDAVEAGRLNAEVAAVFINRKEAKARLRAEKVGIPVQCWLLSHYRRLPATAEDSHAIAGDRGDSTAYSTAVKCNQAGPWFEDTRRHRYDADLAEAVASFQPDLVVLAGWMHLLSPAFLDRFPKKVINLHPALPGQFPGSSAIVDAWEAFQAGHITSTGVMIHYVTDIGVDSGPLITSKEIPIQPDDTLDKLTQKIHQVEHELIVTAIAQLLAEKNG